MVTFNKDFDLEHILGGFKFCKIGYIARELTTEKLSKENRNKKEHEFIQEFERKHKSNNCWNYSNFDSYIEGIPISKQFFFDEYENATEQEFYIHELKCIEENTITDTNPKVYYYDVCLNDILPENILNRVMYSQKRKIEFLQKLIGNNNNENSEIPPTSTNDVENEYPQYFSDYCYSLLLYLNERYETTKLRTKYSNIFHFLKYCEIMECTQLEYIDFVKMKYNIPLSKILNKSLKYLDTIQPKLLRFKSAFDKN